MNFVELTSKNLPRLYAPVVIEFDSLRDKVGPNLGVMFDCDERVTRKCRRVATPEGWKWQIVDLNQIGYWDDPTVYTDQECLDESPMDMSGIKINRGW